MLLPLIQSVSVYFAIFGSNMACTAANGDNNDDNSSHLTSIEDNLNITNIDIPRFSVGGSKDNSFSVLDRIQDLSFYKYIGQENFTNSDIFKITSYNRLIYYSNETFISLAQGSDNGSSQIQNIIPFKSDSFLLSGNGTIDNNYDLSRQLIYNLSTSEITEIFNSSLPNIDTLYVDDDIVYFGGEFSVSNGTHDGNSLAMWDSTTNNIDILPFGGFGNDSEIKSIIKLNNDNFLFTGKFITLDDSNYLNVKNNQSSNYTMATSNPIIPLTHATWDTTGTLSSDLFCPGIDTDDDGWVVHDTTDSFTINLAFSAAPSKVRLYNSFQSDNEVSLFRIETFPAGSIMNLTYIDPISGQLANCDAFCPLYSRTVLDNYYQNTTGDDNIALVNDNRTHIKWNENYQEFGFVNPVSVSSLQFIALSSFGNNVALKGFQLYQATYSIFANDTFNIANCDPNDINTNDPGIVATLSNNNWVPSGSNATYISTSYKPNQETTPEVKFDVNIMTPGNYSVGIITPGCSYDNTCDYRGLVNVSLTDSETNEMLSSILIYQNNEEVKYDSIYVGTLKNSYQVTLRYYSGLYSTNTLTTVVADRVNFDIISLDLNTTVVNTTKLELNGMLQYQLSNFTNSTLENKFGNVSLNQFALDHFSNGSSILASSLSNGSLAITDEQSELFFLNLNDDLTIDTYSTLNVSGAVNKIHSYSSGIAILTDNNYAYLLGSDGDNLKSLGIITNENNKTTQDSTIANITLDSSELLIFNLNQVYNLSSQEFVTNSMDANVIQNITMMAAGGNSNKDTIFYGNVLTNDFVDLNQPVNISGSNNNNVSSLLFGSNIVPYHGVYMNESTSAYFYYNNTDEATQLIFKTGGTSNNLRWESNITTSLYNNNGTILALGVYNPINSSSELSIVNLTTLHIITQEVLPRGSNITSLIDFPSNNTLMVAGDFSFPNHNCSDLCLYNYEDNKWNAFVNNTINGSITQTSLLNSDTLVLSGSFNSNNFSNVNLATMNLSNYEVDILLSEHDAIEHFTIGESPHIISWNNTMLYDFTNNVLSYIPIANVNSSSTVDSIEFVSINKTDDALLLLGQFYDETFGHIQSFIYDFQQWIPYFVYTSTPSQESSNNILPALFMNRDVSQYKITQFVLQNPNGTVSVNQTVTSTRSSSTQSSTSTGSPSVVSAAPTTTSTFPEPVGKSGKKLRTGYVVLIGLALSLATISFLGLAGVMLAFLFRDSSSDTYQAINPTIDENQMVDTLPPEKIMKYI